jgi:hypothetical protein
MSARMNNVSDRSLASLRSTRDARSRSPGIRICATRPDISGVMRTGTTPAAFCSRTQPDNLTISSDEVISLHPTVRSYSNSPQREQRHSGKKLLGKYPASGFWQILQRFMAGGWLTRGLLWSTVASEVSISATYSEPFDGIRSHYTPSRSAGSRRRINLPRRQGLANRLRSELSEDRPQGADARRERAGVVLNDIVQLFDQSGGFFVVKVHERHIGLLIICCEQRRDGMSGTRSRRAS